MGGEFMGIFLIMVSGNVHNEDDGMQMPLVAWKRPQHSSKELRLHFQVLLLAFCLNHVCSCIEGTFWNEEHRVPEAAEATARPWKTPYEKSIIWECMFRKSLRKKLRAAQHSKELHMCSHVTHTEQ